MNKETADKLFDRCEQFMTKSRLLSNLLARLYAKTLIDSKTFISVCFHVERRTCSIIIGDRAVLTPLDRTLFETQESSICFFVEDVPWGYVACSVPFAWTLRDEDRITSPKLLDQLDRTAQQLMDRPANEGLYLDLSSKPSSTFLPRAELEKLLVPYHLYSQAQKAAEDAVKDAVKSLNGLTVDQ